MGVRFQVVRAASLTGVRYYRDPLETGSHVGRVWSATGTLLATVTFTNETASGWQTATLNAPVALAANTTYVVSVNRNDMFGFTPAGFAAQIASGPIRSVVGSNGVYGLTAGDFPTFSYNSGNYYTDLVVQ